MRRAYYIVSLLALVGCATPEQRFQAMRGQCEAYGFSTGTDEFARCMMAIDQADRQRRMAAGMAIMANQPKPQPVYQMPVPQNTNTNCYAVGNSLNCNSTTR